MSKPTERLEAIFEAAVALEPGAQRAGYLDRACPEPELRREVEALLAAHEQPDSVFAEKTARVDGAPSEAVGTVIGRYKLLEKLGEGGFGAVWAAEQKEPVRRRVALKIIKLGMDTRQVVARFEAERQALALMDHPNIAKVLDAGTTDTGRPYFVMELVRGVRLTDYCDQNALSTHERLDLFIKVCHAIQHAHQKGIIHRDIKPSNVLVTLHDGVPVPKVIDFGIAKATQAELTEKTIYTQHHQFIGTPAYMSPEQAEMSGLDLDTRSDIYSLGVLLYELLTGRPPFDAEKLLASGLDEMRRILREVEPVRPSTALGTLAMNDATTLARARKMSVPALANLIRGDLDWIVMKSLEKDRARRYETANALAMDLRRHLNNEPVVARPPSAAYRFSRLVRRNKLAFAAAGAVAAALFVGLFIASWQAVRATNAEQAARLAEHAERTLSEQARADRDRAVRAEADAQVKAMAARDAEATARRRAYAAEMSVAFQALAEDDLPRASQLFERQRPHAGEEDLRGFEWRLLGRLSQESSLHIFADPDPAGPPDRSSDTAVAFSPAEPRLAIARDNGTVRFWNPVTRQPLGESFKAHGGQIRGLAFSPDGKILATASGGLFVYSPCTVRLWDVASQQLLVERTNAHALGIEFLAFSPDGKLLASASVDKTVKLWAVPGAELRATLAGHRDNVSGVRFAPDGRSLATASQDGTVKLWAVADGRELETVSSNRAPVAAIAFSPDGRTLAVASGDSTVVFWDVAAKRRTGWLPQRSIPSSVDFSPDGKHLACGQQGAVAVWDLATETEVDSLTGHDYAVTSLAFSPDGRFIATSCADGKPRLWRGAPQPKVPSILAHADGVTAVSFSRNGRILATGSGQFWQPWRPSEIKLWDAATGRLLKVLPGHAGDVMWLIFTPDDQTLISVSRDATARLWDVTSGRELDRFEVSNTHGVWHAALSPDGKTLAVSHGRGRVVRLWDVSTREELPALPASGTVDRVVFTPDGRHLVSADGGGWIVVWDTATWEQARAWKDKGFYTAMGISPDGKTLATVRLTESIKLWDLATGEQVGALAGHRDVVGSLVFSPDGCTLVSSSGDGVVKFWSVTALQEIVTLRAHKYGVTVAFSPDGNTLATASLDKTVRLWRAIPAAEVGTAAVK